MTDDDDLWSRLRADAATDDLDANRAAAIARAAHERLRNPHRAASAAIRALESAAVTGVVVAQLAWAWSVVLG
jgi:hypothetical protein